MIDVQRTDWLHVEADVLKPDFARRLVDDLFSTGGDARVFREFDRATDHHTPARLPELRLCTFLQVTEQGGDQFVDRMEAVEDLRAVVQMITQRRLDRLEQTSQRGIVEGQHNRMLVDDRGAASACNHNRDAAEALCLPADGAACLAAGVFTGGVLPQCDVVLTIHINQRRQNLPAAHGGGFHLDGIKLLAVINGSGGVRRPKVDAKPQAV